MNRIILLLVLMLSQSWALNPGKYQQILNDLTQKGIPGVSMVIQSPKGQWSGASGYADIDAQRKMRSDDISRIASISKTFTGVAFLKLEEQGLLSLGQKLSEFLDDKTLKGIANAKEVTLTQLLNHSSGIPSYNGSLRYGVHLLNDPTTNRFAPMTCLDYIRGSKAKFSPGEKFKYSNSNYVLLGLVLAKVGKKSHYDMIHDLIISPLGLENTYFDKKNPLPQGIIQGYADLFGEGKYILGTQFAFGLQTLDGGMISNAQDLVIFLESVFEKGFLKQSSLDKLTQFIDVSSKDFEYRRGFIKYGLGLRYWETPHGPAYGHSGESFGYLSFAFYFPKQKTYFTLIANASYGVANDILEKKLKEIPELILD